MSLGSTHLFGPLFGRGVTADQSVLPLPLGLVCCRGAAWAHISLLSSLPIYLHGRLVTWYRYFRSHVNKQVPQDCLKSLGH